MPLLLLTWHGTVVGLHATGALAHIPLPPDNPDVTPLEGPWPSRPPSSGVAINLPVTGPVRAVPSLRSGGICLVRDGLYLCAERDSADLRFDRTEAGLWEALLPVSQEDVATLGRLLGGQWILRDSRRVLPRRSVRLEAGFVLRLGQTGIDLAACLPFPAADGTGEDAVTIAHEDAAVVLVPAGPRSSALLQTAMWPVRARRQAEMLALAVRRQVEGHEPTQAAFEADVGFLLERQGAPGLDALIETVLGEASGGPVRAATTARPGSGAPACPVVPLGTSCVLAMALRQGGLQPLPMPFDWLGTTPAMVRACLEDDFAQLMDPAQHVSLTGAAAYGEPEHGCVHLAYRTRFGIARVFNHNDPTRPADARYMQMCIDRLRDVIAAAGPKVFVQIREAEAAGAAEFAATAGLLDRLTQGALLLQIEVDVPDRRRAMPLLSVAGRIGAHVRYSLGPLSQIGGVEFGNPADAVFLAQLVGAHAARPATSRAVASASRRAVGAAMHRFAEESPQRTQLPADGVMPRPVELGNFALYRFCQSTGIARRFGFGAYDARELGEAPNRESCLVEVSGGRARLRVEAGHDGLWLLLLRALSLVVVLDALFEDAAPADCRFMAELGDSGHAERSVAFCSARPQTCLLPDPDFIVSGGYDDLRLKMAQRTQRWADRDAVVFWRGATTGVHRHAPPAEGEADDLTWLPRLDLCARAARSPLAAHYDVGITDIAQVEAPHLVARIHASGLCRPRVGRDAFLGHRAVLVIDGNASAWSALFSALLTGSCVLKVESPGGFRQWYYQALVPWLHFIPVQSDLEDLDAVVAWMLEHDADAQAIGAAGRAFAEAMTYESVVADAAERLRGWIAGRSRGFAA